MWKKKREQRAKKNKKEQKKKSLFEAHVINVQTNFSAVSVNFLVSISILIQKSAIFAKNLNVLIEKSSLILF